jgi:exonuclease SbcC
LPKILATADWHLGAYVGPQCDDPMKRMENTIKCLDVLVETARQEQPDIILVAGDVFHAARVWDERRLVEIRTAANYLNELGIIAPVVVLYGTPSHENLETFYTLQEMVDDFQVALDTEPFIRKISTKSGPIQIAGLPGFDKGHFRTQFPGLSAEEENQVFTQQLAQIVQGLSAQVDSAMPSVLMAHHTVVGCDMGNGTHIFQANEVVLDAATLDNSAFDLVCLGHIHKAQRVMTCSKPVFYAGSIDADRFNDEGHEKGFYLHDTEWPVNGHMFIKTPAREFLTCRWDIEAIKSYTELGMDAFHIVDETLGDKIIRVLYTCDTETEKALDKKKLERDLYAAGAYYVSVIQPESITAAVNRERMHEKMTVEGCLERYLKEKYGQFTGQEIADITWTAEPIIEIAEASSPMGATSGLFLPVEIEVHNYRSYEEEKLSFQDIFFAMVNGINGSGKSSLFMDAITDCLYEETRENELTAWIRNGEKSGSISFTFSLGNDLWRVTRTRSKSKGTLALARSIRDESDDDRIYDIGNGWEDKSAELMKDTQQKIIDLLGMDCDTFQSCVLIMQDRYGKFMEASKNDRMAVLANLLGLGIYDELSEITKGKLTDANREIKTKKIDIFALETEVATENNLHTGVLQIQAQLNVAADDLQQKKDELATLQAKLGASEGYVRESVELEKELRQKTGTYTEKKGKRSDLQGRVIETETFLQNEQTILGKCAELNTARMGIAALDGKMQLLNDKKIRCKKLNMDLITAQTYKINMTRTLEAIAAGLQGRERLERLVEGSTIEQDLEECERKAKQHRDLDNTLTRMENESRFFHRETGAACDSKNAKLSGLKKQVEMLDNSNCIDVVQAQCSFLQSAKLAAVEIRKLELEIETYVAERIKIAEITGREFAELEEKIRAVDYGSDLHNVLLQDVKIYRDAKDKLAKMAGDAATANELKRQDGENVLRIEAYGNELETLSAEIYGLEKETGSFAELNCKARELLQYEGMKMQLPKAKQFVESTVEAIGQLDADLLELNMAIGRINERIAELAKLTSDMWDMKVQLNGTEACIKTLENSISIFNQQIGNITAQLVTVACKKDLLSAAQEDLQQSAKQAALLTVLSEAFSRDGIPYQIIRDVVPELEATANNILIPMSGGKMRLEFRMIKAQKSHQNVEVPTLDIKIIGLEALEIDYKSLSGGQKSRCALTVIFSLSMIKASRVGMQLGFLFMDEPARGLDREGVEAFCEALAIIHEMFSFMKIVVISHDEDMKMAFPQQMYVEMTEQGSKVRRSA